MNQGRCSKHVARSYDILHILLFIDANLRLEIRLMQKDSIKAAYCDALTLEKDNKTAVLV